MNRFVSLGAPQLSNRHTSVPEAIPRQYQSLALHLQDLSVMTAWRFRILMLAVSASALVGQIATGVIGRPLPSAQEMANLESRVLQNPEDIDARVQLLRLYLDTPPASSYSLLARRSLRLQHILYLVEHHPEAAASASKVAYVHRSDGAYASVGDLEAVRNQWLAAVQGHPKNSAVILNAVRFLDIEDREDAEQVLRRAMESDPENREFAANLGFLYAMEILGNALDLANKARAELGQSSNAIVLAAAGTALPNMMGHGGIVNEKMFDLANELTARARNLAPDDTDIQGPMPLIKYFADAEGAPERSRNAPAIPSSRAIIGRDGTIQTFN